MKTLEIQIVQGDRPCGYACTSEDNAQLITEHCGCKPSKWDGCRAADVAPQIWQGMTRILQNNGIDPAYEKGNFADTYDFLNTVFNLCHGHPEARVEIRF